MNLYERYKKLIEDAKSSGQCNEEFITQTKTRLKAYLDKGKLTQSEYNELIGMV